MNDVRHAHPMKQDGRVVSDNTATRSAWRRIQASNTLYLLITILACNIESMLAIGWHPQGLCSRHELRNAFVIITGGA